MTFVQRKAAIGDFRIDYVKDPGISRVSMPNFHAHPTYELYYLCNGERVYYINGNEHYVKRGDLLLIDHNVIHKTFSTSSPDYERILVQIPVKFLESLQFLDFNPRQCFNFASPVFSLSKKDQSVIESLLYSIFDEIENKNSSYLTVIQILLTQILIRINRYAESVDHAISQSSHVNEKIAEIVNYIGENFMKPISLSLISKEFHISNAHLARTFKKITGLTLIEYLNNVRINRARNLLRNTDNLVSDIALAVGFGSITHFERMFKRSTGYAPSVYRKLTYQRKS